MISILKIAAFTVAALAVAQLSFADHPGAVLGGNVRPPGNPAPPPASPVGTVARPASNGSPPIYYSGQPWVPPSVMPPNLNLLPSWGYSTGLYVPQFQSSPTTFNPMRPSGPAVGPGLGLGVGIGYTPLYYNYAPPVVVNQYYYSPPQAYNYTTNIAPRRLTYGVLNR